MLFFFIADMGGNGMSAAAETLGGKKKRKLYLKTLTATGTKKGGAYIINLKLA